MVKIYGRITKHEVIRSCNIPVALDMPHSTVDILHGNHQKLLAKCLSELVSFLSHDNQATKQQRSQVRHWDLIFTERILNCLGTCQTFFLTIFTISWSTSFSATCIWTKSPQFLIRVSSNWKQRDIIVVVEYRINKFVLSRTRSRLRIISLIGEVQHIHTHP
jgi:hypothetical protein